MNLVDKLIKFKRPNKKKKNTVPPWYPFDSSLYIDLECQEEDNESYK